MKGKQSPWGTIDHAEALGGGAWSVSTPSHGGIYLPLNMEMQMPQTFKSKRNPNTGWYEEDCEWALVYLCFSFLDWSQGDDSRKQTIHDAAHATAKRYYPEALIEHLEALVRF